MMLNAGDRDGPVLHLDMDFRAPRDKVYKSWVTPELIEKWHFVPGEFKNTLTEIDLRELGPYTMRLDPLRGGQPTIFHGHYLTVEPLERLEYTWTGGPAANYWTIVQARFTDLENGGSHIELRHGVFETQEHCDLHLEGWIGCMHNFATFLGEE